MNRIVILLLVLPIFGWSQIKNKPGKEFPVGKAIDKIVIDGELTEQTWKVAEKGGDFFMSKPIDSIPPTNPTYFQLSFDEENLYVAYECIDDGKAPIVQSLRRDFEFQPNDNVGIYLNTYNDFTNGFYFNITPYGVQREGIMFNAGSTSNDYSSFWDNKWYSAVKRHNDRWIAEIAIPFKSIRYNLESWNFDVLRNDVERNQISSWIATPVQYLPAAFANSGKIIWQDELPKPGMNVSLIPYVTGKTAHDFETGEPTDNSSNVGLDAKVALTPSLNLDLTINPDFSNVEVDRQVINLTRFEFGFPERRQFFLENSDLFSGPGYPDTRVFFSRRIGLAVDTSDHIVKVPIQYGARISGKLGQKWRVGLMNMQTGEKKSIGLPSQNYSVAVVQRQVFSRSNLDVVFVNKESLGLGTYDTGKFYHESLIREITSGGKTDTTLNKFNRVVGADFNLFTKNNRWVGDMYYFHSIDAFDKDKAFSHGAFISYNTRNLTAYVGNQGVGKNYRADVGFTPGLNIYPGYYSTFTRIETPIYPKSGGVVSYRPATGYTFIMTPDGKVTDRTFSVDFGVTRKNTSGFGISFNRIYQVLTSDFSPVDDTDEDLYADLKEGQVFEWNEMVAGFNTDLRKLLNFNGGVRFGQFYNGHRTNIISSLAYRYQPFGSITVDVDYNYISLPAAYGKAKYLLVSPRVDLTFSDKLFLTTFVQYNDREDNVNLNARFQWRFKPASDFFVVYTENYLPEPFKSKNRALVLKLTYWFNL
ncbi:MAG: carbohydrate binding family 9 domain-containing protein [Flammeovirgaceae bacterium]|nr:carbohydrate binding family 9 domain-containing protein [Flammeovirgaceae bacterium]